MLRGLLISQRRLVLPGTLLLMGHQVCEALVPVVIGAALDRAIAPSDGDQLILWLAVLAALFATLSFCYRMGERTVMRAALLGEHALRLKIVEHVLRGAGASRTPGGLVGVATSDAHTAARISEAIPYVIAGCAAILVAAVVLLTISPWLGLLVLVGLPLVLVAVDRLGRPLARRASAQQERAEHASGAATDLVRGLRVVKGLGAERAAGDRYRARSREALDATLHAAGTEAGAQAATRIVTGAFLAVVALVAGRLAAEGEITIGDLIAAVGLTQFLVAPLGMLAYLGTAIARCRASAHRVQELLDEEIPAPDDAPAVVAPESGRLVGVVAADPADAGGLLSALAAAGDALVAPHEADLFEGTLHENVAGPGARHGAGVDAALDAAAADEVAAALPDGAHTWLGERGRSLSGGQRQRVALARALAAAAEVLVLHDPTTAIDAATEARVAGGLRRVRAGRTTVVVTSSPALLAVTDVVVLVEDGAVAARGVHGELVRDSARYRELVLG